MNPDQALSVVDEAPMIDQVLQLPVVMRRRISHDYIDVNQHMNIQHYLLETSIAVGMLYADAGVDDDYRSDRRKSLFTAEQHLKYLGEVRLGDEISVHAALLNRSHNALHAMSFIVAQAPMPLSCILEMVLVHVDMDSRRTVDFPQDIAARLDAAIHDQAAITSQLRHGGMWRSASDSGPCP